MKSVVVKYHINLLLSLVFSFTLISILNAQERTSPLDTADILERISKLEEEVNGVEQLRSKIKILSDSIRYLDERRILLDSLNGKLTESVENRNRVEYEEKNHSIVVALERSDKLLESYLNIIERLEKEEIILDLLEINNPTSNALGFRFSDIVVIKAKKVFHEKLRDDTKVRNRWGAVVDKIVNNNFVTSILKSNPITELVSNVVISASSFVREKKRNEGNDNSRVVELESAFEEQDIKEFLGELEEYILFYEELSKIGDEYRLELASLLEKTSDLDLTVTNFRRELLEILKIDPSVHSVTIPFAAKYDLVRSQQFATYQDILVDSVFIVAAEHASSFEILELEVQGIESEYKKIFKKFLDGYLAQIKRAEDLSEDDEDLSVRKTRINRLIGKIEKFEEDYLE